MHSNEVNLSGKIGLLFCPIIWSCANTTYPILPKFPIFIKQKSVIFILSAHNEDKPCQVSTLEQSFFSRIKSDNTIP